MRAAGLSTWVIGCDDSINHSATRIRHLPHTFFSWSIQSNTLPIFCVGFDWCGDKLPIENTHTRGYMELMVSQALLMGHGLSRLAGLVKERSVADQEVFADSEGRWARILDQ